jgi:hypothetical protein
VRYVYTARVRSNLKKPLAQQLRLCSKQIPISFNSWSFTQNEFNPGPSGCSYCNQVHRSHTQKLPCRRGICSPCTPYAIWAAAYPSTSLAQVSWPSQAACHHGCWAISTIRKCAPSGPAWMPKPLPPAPATMRAASCSFSSTSFTTRLPAGQRTRCKQLKAT